MTIPAPIHPNGCTMLLMASLPSVPISVEGYRYEFLPRIDGELLAGTPNRVLLQPNEVPAAAADKFRVIAGQPYDGARHVVFREPID